MSRGNGFGFLGEGQQTRCENESSGLPRVTPELTASDAGSAAAMLQAPTRNWCCVSLKAS